MKKKLLILPLIVALLIACMLPSIASEYDQQTNGVAITSGVGAPGKEVKMQVSLPETFADSVGIRFTIEGEGLTMSDASNWLVDGDLTDVHVQKGVAVWATDSPQTLKGNIFEVVFKISENAQIGDEFTVKCQVSATWNGKDARSGETAATVAVRNSAKISGTVTSYGTKTDTVTVELVNSQSVVVQKQELVDGDNTYEFDVDQDDYVIRVSKTKHCTREYEVSMADMEDKVQDVKIILYGDFDVNGEVDVFDVNDISLYIVGNIEIDTEDSEYLLKAMDVEKDDFIDVFDVWKLSGYIVGNDTIF